MPGLEIFQRITDNSWLEINKDRPGHMLSSSSLGEEGVEGVVSCTDSLVRGHLAIRLYSMLQAVQLPARVTNLDPGLADVDRDALTLQRRINNLDSLGMAIILFPAINLVM